MKIQSTLQETADMFEEKYKTGDNAFSIDTVNQINEADANDLKSFIREREVALLKSIVEEVENIELKVDSDNPQPLDREEIAFNQALSKVISLLTEVKK